MSDGNRIGDYSLVERIAVGGMAELFLARRQGPAGFERAVVIKRLLPQYAKDPKFTQMFLDEARLVASLHHSHIVSVYDLGEADGSYFIAMEYLVGENLAQVLAQTARKRRRLPMGLAVQIALSVARGLHHAHTQVDAQGVPLGIVHRDISPQNIILTFDGNVKIVDFGIAKAAIRGTTTQTGELKGKVGYMAPEQLAQSRADARTDIYALGVVLFEMLAGRRMVDPRVSLADMVRHGPAARPSLRDMAPETPQVLVEIVARCIDVAPDRRYGSCEELALALQEYLQGMAAPESLAAFMKEIFGDTHVGHKEDLYRTPSPQMLSALVIDRDRDRDRSPTRVENAAPVISIDLQDAGLFEASAPKHTPRRWPYYLAGVGAVIAVSFATIRGPRPDDEPTGEAVALPPTTSPAPTPARVVPETAPVAPTPSPARAGTQPKHGMLTLETNLTWEVYLGGLGGRLLGLTPLSESLPAGRHKLSLVQRQEGLSRTLAIDIAAGQNMRQKFHLQRGSLSVEATPWADVYINQRKLGTTPLFDVELWEGTYQVTLENPDLGLSKKVPATIRPKETTKILETLR